MAVGRTGKKRRLGRQLSRDIPRIRQDDLLARTGSRCAFALLHGHQVADVGQHRLEVRHFPRWSLKSLRWTRLSTLGAVFSTALGLSLSSYRAFPLTVATPGTLPTPTFWTNDRRTVHRASRDWQLRRVPTRDFHRGNHRFDDRLSLRAREVNDTPFGATQHTITRVILSKRSRGRRTVDFPAAHRESSRRRWEWSEGIRSRDAVIIYANAFTATVTWAKSWGKLLLTDWQLQSHEASSPRALKRWLADRSVLVSPNFSPLHWLAGDLCYRHGESIG